MVKVRTNSGLFMLATTALEIPLSMTAEKQKTTSKRQGPLNRWRTPASLGSQTAGIPVHLRSLWITCTKTTRLSEKDPFRSQQNFPNSLWGSSRPKETWPWSLADSFTISVRKGHVPRRTKLALGSPTRVRATCILTSSQRPFHPTQTEILPSLKVIAIVIRSQMRTPGLDTI